MKNKKFSIVEMLIVLAIICLLLAIALPIIRVIVEASRKTATRNFLNQQKGMIASYFTDYGVLPLSMHATRNSFSDTTPVEYWKRIPNGLFRLNKIPTGTTKNAELSFDLYDGEGGSVSNQTEFNTIYPSKNLVIPLDPWYNGPATPAKLEQEELNVVTHSSRFLNYYLSGSGFEDRGAYVKNESKWIANEDTNFRLSYERSALVKPFLYFLKDETIIWNGGSPEVKLTTVPPFTSYIFDKTLIYFDYVPKIIGAWNAQTYSKNLEEDKFRRLYLYSDLNSDGTNKPIPPLIDKYAAKKITLGSDRIMFNSNFYSSSSQKDARAQKDAATAAQVAAAALLAAAVTPAQIATATAAVASAQLASDNADIALAKATPGDYNNSNSFVYMRAHTENVKCLVDAFNSPIVYITYTNQRKESAKTYKYMDANGVADPSKDKSIRAESFVLYSLGVNKADDSNLGENPLSNLGTGDDIIEMAGQK